MSDSITCAPCDQGWKQRSPLPFAGAAEELQTLSSDALAREYVYSALWWVKSLSDEEVLVTATDLINMVQSPDVVRRRKKILDSIFTMLVSPTGYAQECYDLAKILWKISNPHELGVLFWGLRKLGSIPGDNVVTTGKVSLYAQNIWRRTFFLALVLRYMVGNFYLPCEHGMLTCASYNYSGLMFFHSIDTVPGEVFGHLISSTNFSDESLLARKKLTAMSDLLISRGEYCFLPVAFTASELLALRERYSPDAPNEGEDKLTFGSSAREVFNPDKIIFHEVAQTLIKNARG